VITKAIIALIVAAASFFPTSSFQASLNSEQTCSVTGMLVDAVTAQPLSNGSVSLRHWGGSAEGSGAGNTSAITDVNGRFSFENLAPGTYMIVASHSGYLNQRYGGPGFRSRLVRLASGQHLDSVVLSLTPGATISGRVVNEQGKPLSGIALQAFLHSYQLGKSQFQQTANTVSTEAGEYQFTTLPPGKYYLRAIPPQPSTKKTDAAKSLYVSSYFPTPPSIGGSTALVLHPGEQMAALAITLTAVHTVTLSGRVLPAPTKSSTGETELALVEEGSIAPWPYEISVDAKGTFDLPGVPPGNYLLMAHRAAESEKQEPLWGQKAVQVGDVDLHNIEVSLRPGVSLNGHISVSGTKDVDLSRFTLVLDPAQSNVARGFSADIQNAAVSQDGGFVFANVRPGSYRIHFLNAPGGSYYLQSTQTPDILEVGITVSDQPLRNLDLMLSSDAARVEGTVQQDQQPAAGVTVVLVPDGARRAQISYFHQTTTDRQGRFVLEGVAPGGYKLFAWQTIERGAYADPEFLQLFEDQGTAVNLKEGASVTTQLDLIPTE